MAEAVVENGEAPAPEADLDELLDLDRHKLANVPKKKPSPSERWMKYLGFPGGLALFLILLYMETPIGMTASGQAVVAAFLLALTWWITEPLPTYVTSLVLMANLILLDAWEQKQVLAVLGLDVIWLNVMAFILSSILVKTNLAKRLALWLTVKFGTNARSALLAFVILQLVLAPFIPATAARTVMTLPIMIVVAAIYGSTSDTPRPFGRNLFLLNLFGINLFSAGFISGSSANILAIKFIENMTGEKVFYTDWMFANLPIVCIAMLFAWWIGPKFLFKIPPDDATPHLKGGLDALGRQLDKMGPVSAGEIRALLIFGAVIFLWCTDRWHLAMFGFQIDPTVTAILGAIVCLLPRIGILAWNEADIPWHLMLFSAGAYAGGMALEDTGAARWAVGRVFTMLNISRDVPFFTVYLAVIAVMMYSHLFFTSKNMRTLIMLPFVILMARQLGIKPLSLALPAAFTIDWVIGLPISAKPNVILFSTGQFSVIDNLKFALIVATFGVFLLAVAGVTWFRFLGITP